MTSSKILDLSIIIPFKDKADLTIACMDSLAKYGDPVREILLVSNNSSAHELAKVQAAASKHANMKVKEYNHPFNFHSINNWGVKQTSGKVLFFLNNDIELTDQSSGLIEAMYQKSLEPDMGAVGCVLVYEDRKTVQHAGVYLIPGGTADHAYIGKKLSFIKKKQPLDVSDGREFSAVTAAAVMVERKKYDKIGGMNEKFIICGGDVDLCLRLQDAGHRTWLIGYNHGYMIHKESKSRSMLAVPYVDFVESYRIYVKHFDTSRGDKFLPPEVVAYV